MNELVREREREEREFQTKKDEGQRDSEKRLNKGDQEHLQSIYPLLLPIHTEIYKAFTT